MVLSVYTIWKSVLVTYRLKMLVHTVVTTTTTTAASCSNTTTTTTSSTCNGSSSSDSSGWWKHKGPIEGVIYSRKSRDSGYGSTWVSIYALNKRIYDDDFEKVFHLQHIA